MQSESIDLREIRNRLWSGRGTIMLFSLLFFLLGIIYLHFTAQKYTATIVLIPTQRQSQGISGLSDIASLTGIDINRSQSVSPYTIFPDALNSRMVAADLAKRAPDILPVLFKNQWDEQNHAWHEPRGVLRDTVHFVENMLGIPVTPWAAPGAAELQQLIIDEVRAQSAPSQRSVLTLTYDNKDPVFAAHFLQSVYEATDSALRQITLVRASKYATYVENKLNTIQVSDLRQVLMQSLSEQETLIMMSSSDTPFAAQPLGPAVTPRAPSQPKPLLILALSLVAGMVAGTALAYFQISVWRNFRALFSKRSGSSTADESHPD